MRPALLLSLCALTALAPVPRHGAEHGGETLLRLASGTRRVAPSRQVVSATPEPASIISRLYAADFHANFILRTNYAAPSPVGSVAPPTVVYVPISHAVVIPPAKQIVTPAFIFPSDGSNYYWHILAADSPAGPWHTNEKNLKWPPVGVRDVVWTNQSGVFKMLGTPEMIP